MAKHLVIIPAYNEAGGIGKIIKAIRILDSSLDILVIDDGSQDDTGKVARQAGATVIRHIFNMGYGAALQTGYKYAREKGCDYLVQIDADGQHNVEDIKYLFAEIKKNEVDVVIGSRYLGQRNYKPSFARRIGTVIFRELTALATREKLTDPTSGFQALNKKTISFYAINEYPSDFPDANVIIWLTFLGFKIKEIPVRMHQRVSGKSKCITGAFAALYYMYKMLLSIVVLLMFKKEFSNRKQALR